MIKPVPVLLRQVAREDFPCILSQKLLEDGCQGDHWFPSAQLGALHHALLVIHKEVGTAGQDCSALLRARLGWALCSEISHKAINELAKVPVQVQRHTEIYGGG